MSTLSGTINSISLVSGPSGPGARKVYEIGCSFTQTFTAGDIAQLVSVDAAIKSDTKNGKTFTTVASALNPGCGGQPGLDASGVAAYAMGLFTNSSGTLTFGLGSSTTNAALTGPISGVRFLVVGDES